MRPSRDTDPSGAAVYVNVAMTFERSRAVHVVVFRVADGLEGGVVWELAVCGPLRQVVDGCRHVPVAHHVERNFSFPNGSVVVARSAKARSGATQAARHMA